MKVIKFDADLPDHVSHECDSFREGEWIIFHCPQCPMYERRINRRTGEMEIRHAENEMVRHFGRHEPQRFDHLFRHVN